MPLGILYFNMSSQSKFANFDKGEEKISAKSLFNRRVRRVYAMPRPGECEMLIDGYHTIHEYHT